MDETVALLAELLSPEAASEADAALQGLCSAIGATIHADGSDLEVIRTQLDVLLSPAGLPQFVCSAGPSKVRAGALNLVSNLISLGGVLALPYAGGVRRACLLLLRTDQPADVATAALSVFDRLCEARVPAETMRPAELERELQEAKTRSTGQYTKKGSRPRGSLFKTLGLVLQAYPRSFDEKVRRGLHFHEAVEICSELTIPPAVDVGRAGCLGGQHARRVG